MLDQIIIGGKGSYTDFSASLAGRRIGKPKKKSIKETVPFSNNTYDFSKIDGELYWEEREIEYIFEITADSPEELEELKLAFSGWVMNVFEEDIHDPYIFGYHFKGTYEDMDPEDDEGLDKTTLTVKFTAYPYMIADHSTVFQLTGTTRPTTPLRAVNGSHHPVRAKLRADFEGEENDGANMQIQINGDYVMLINGVQYEYDQIPVGLLEINVTALTHVAGTKFTLSISFDEEVL